MDRGRGGRRGSIKRVLGSIKMGRGGGGVKERGNIESNIISTNLLHSQRIVSI